MSSPLSRSIFYTCCGCVLVCPKLSIFAEIHSTEDSVGLWIWCLEPKKLWQIRIPIWCRNYLSCICAWTAGTRYLSSGNRNRVEGGSLTLEDVASNVREGECKTRNQNLFFVHNYDLNCASMYFDKWGWSIYQASLSNDLNYPIYVQKQSGS
jgi:hypothetical protein